MSLADDLRSCRQVIGTEKTWCIGSQRDKTIDGYKHCAIGAVNYCPELVMIHPKGVHEIVKRRNAVIDALYEVLYRRFHLNLLPEPVYGSSLSSPEPWKDLMVSKYFSKQAVITQFNNSVDHKTVLAWFDEAIAMAEAKEIEDKPLLLEPLPTTEKV